MPDIHITKTQNYIQFIEHLRRYRAWYERFSLAKSLRKRWNYFRCLDLAEAEATVSPFDPGPPAVSGVWGPSGVCYLDCLGRKAGHSDVTREARTCTTHAPEAWVLSCRSGRSLVRTVEYLIKLPFLWCGKRSGLRDDNGDNLNYPEIIYICLLLLPKTIHIK